MSLRSEIQANFIDGFNLVSPNPVPKGEQRASDNGVCFTSEYIIYLNFDEGKLSFNDKSYYRGIIYACCLATGLVSRAPKDKALQPPDDYLAIAAACSYTNLADVADNIIDYGLKNYGCYDNSKPYGPWRKEAFLWRQPQLIAAMYSAAQRGKYNPFVRLLNVYAAICILVGNMHDDPREVDGRRLSFLLIKAMNSTSLLCRLASKVWKQRQEDTYGKEFMKVICSIYYKGVDGDLHPFAEYARYE